MQVKEPQTPTLQLVWLYNCHHRDETDRKDLWQLSVFLKASLRIRKINWLMTMKRHLKAMLGAVVMALMTHSVLILRFQLRSLTATSLAPWLPSLLCLTQPRIISTWWLSKKMDTSLRALQNSLTSSRVRHLREEDRWCLPRAVKLPQSKWSTKELLMTIRRTMQNLSSLSESRSWLSKIQAPLKQSIHRQTVCSSTSRPTKFVKRCPAPHICVQTGRWLALNWPIETQNKVRRAVRWPHVKT